MFPSRCIHPPCRNMLVNIGKERLREGDAVPCEQKLLVRRDQPKRVNECVARLGRQRQLIQKHQDIHKDEQDVADRRSCAQDVNAQWDHVGRFPRSFKLLR